MTLKRTLVVACGAALLLATPAVQASTQGTQKDTGKNAVVIQDSKGQDKVVIKDDTTPKVKKGAKVVADAEITTAVKTKLMGDKVARGTAIDVATRNGVVTLSGTVPTQADKARIGLIAEKTKGVKRVENNLTVSAL